MPERPAVHPARAAWLEALEAETTAHRERRAQAYELSAGRKRRELLVKGLSESEADRGALWYASRARGQRERFDNERQCQRGETMQIVCSACGCSSVRKKSCGLSSICDSCRGRSLAKRRGRFARARHLVLREKRLRGFRNPRRAGGAYSEKLLTLTLPHAPEHGVTERIGYVLDAWPHFLKAANAWLREAGHDVSWLRHHEWTPGGDEQGHPHIHVWIFGPFLQHALLVSWWRAALVRAGFPEALTRKLVVDIRRVRNGKTEDGDGIVTEVLKYMTKDVVAGGKYVAPATRARVYEAYDGRRLEQASKGFLAQAASESCCPDCDARAAFVVRIGAGPWRGGPEAKRAWDAMRSGEPRSLGP